MNLSKARLYCMKHDSELSENKTLNSKSVKRYIVAGSKYIWFNYHRIKKNMR